MVQTNDSTPTTAVDLAQAVELIQLVDLEARWENLRDRPADAPGTLTLAELQSKQNAHRAFQSRLVAYNQRYTPAHVPELLLNTPARLGKWCRTMCDLCRRVELEPQVSCPVHLVAKAYRWADKMARRLVRERAPQQAPPTRIAEAVHALEELGKWCDVQGTVARPA